MMNAYVIYSSNPPEGCPEQNKHFFAGLEWVTFEQAWRYASRASAKIDAEMLRELGCRVQIQECAWPKDGRAIG
jgi:hypothetical protein